MSDPLADVIVSLVEDAIVAGVHLLDPAARQQTIREAVERERARWAALDPRTASEAADDAARRHHVPMLPTDAAHEARVDRLVDAHVQGTKRMPEDDGA